MRGESMKGKSKKSTYSTTFGIDPFFIAEFSDWHFIKKSSEPNQMIWLCIKNRK